MNSSSSFAACGLFTRFFYILLGWYLGQDVDIYHNHFSKTSIIESKGSRLLISERLDQCKSSNSFDQRLKKIVHRALYNFFSNSKAFFFLLMISVTFL
ncbi:hypothetical protein BD560DRAFT_389570 [Blakeslea trispora]|nr:hypothetical protein BD560DRAFT_389570 [Blakeslea trispora]